MRSSHDVTSVPASPLDNAFAPAYLARLREQDDVLTAAEAELAGPWKIEPVRGKPGAVAILRLWEDLAIGDPPVAVLWHLEKARLRRAIPWLRYMASRVPRSPAGSIAMSRGGPRGSTCWRRSFARLSPSPSCSKRPVRAPRSRSAAFAFGSSRRKEGTLWGRRRSFRPLSSPIP